MLRRPSIEHLHGCKFSILVCWRDQDLFYNKMLADPRLNFFFEGIDMQQQRGHQVQSQLPPSLYQHEECGQIYLRLDIGRILRAKSRCRLGLIKERGKE